MTLLKRKSLLDFLWSRLKNRFFNEFSLGSFFSVSRVCYMFWTLVLTEQVAGIYTNSHWRVAKGIYLLFACTCIFSLKHFISQECSPLHYESFSYPLSTETAFQIEKEKQKIKVKYALLRQQIWNTNTYTQ